MRIAYLVNQYPKISHSFIRREIDALERHGFEVERFSVRRTTEPLADERDVAESARTRVILDGGWARLAASLIRTVITRPWRVVGASVVLGRLGWRSRRGLAYHVVYLAEACVLRELVAASRCEHVHAHFATNPATVAALCRALGGPEFSFTFHGPEFFEFPDHARLAAKVVDARFVVAISHHGRSQLMRITPRSAWDKLRIVHCGVDREFLDRPSTPVPSDARVVCVARLDAAKGIHVLVEAAARLAREGRAFTVAVVGDGPMRPSVEDAIRRHGLERHVLLLGWKSQHDVVREIEAARALVLPSFEEGLPVVFMESLALERPVVSTFIAGIPELVRPGETGWLVPASDVESLAAALREVLDAEPARLRAMGARGAELVRAHHDAEREAVRLGEQFTRSAPARAPADGSRAASRDAAREDSLARPHGTPDGAVRPAHTKTP